MDKPAISVIIPCRNEKKFIGLTLDSIARQSFPQEKLELIVVDGMSDDGTRNVLADYRSRISRLSIFDNDGKITAAGCNVGIQKAQGETIAIIGGHCELSTDYLLTCYQYLQTSSPQTAYVAGRIKTLGNSKVGQAIATAMSSSFGVGNALFRYSNEELDVDTAAFGLYRRQVFDAIGVFDEQIIGAEDHELSFRVTKAGYRIHLLPNISATYFARETYRGLWLQYRNYGKGKVLVLSKHGNLPSMRGLVPPLFVFSLGFGLIFGLLFHPLLWFWVGLIMVYGLFALFFAIKAADDKKLSTVLDIFRAYNVMHTGYGVGFWMGIVSLIRGRGKKLA
jgi:glycosyltransferase involved in cell wall biosynthesis